MDGIPVDLADVEVGFHCGDMVCGDVVCDAEGVGRGCWMLVSRGVLVSGG